MAEQYSIRLRAPEPSDVALLYTWENDMALWNYSENLTQLSVFQIEQFILNNQDIFTNRQIRFMIELSTEELAEPIGTVDLYDFDPIHARAGVGIMIEARHRRKGFAKKALVLLEQYAFEKLLLRQLYCYINADNEESIRLFLSRKFVHSGTKKEWIRTKDSWIDQLHFQLIRQ